VRTWNAHSQNPKMMTSSAPTTMMRELRFMWVIISSR
jgi:hypothetical protein